MNLFMQQLIRGQDQLNNMLARKRLYPIGMLPPLGPSVYSGAGITYGGSNNLSSFADNFAWIAYTGGNFAQFANRGYIVKLTSSGLTIWGYLGEAGSGEALSATELLPDNTFDTGTGWAGTNWSVSGGKAVASASSTAFSQSINLEVGALYKGSLVCDSLTNGTYTLLIDNFRCYDSSLFTDTGTKSAYRVSNNFSGRSCGLSAYTALTATFPEISQKKVIAPSSTGCKVYKDPACLVNGWNDRTSAFNMNNTTYQIGVHKPI